MTTATNATNEQLGSICPSPTSAVDADELSIKHAAGLVIKTMAQQCFVEGAKLAGTAGLQGTVNDTSLILDSQGVELQGASACRPLFGVCMKDGHYAFVIHPRVYTFNELSEQGFLSEIDVLVLTHAAKRVVRQSNRMQLRLKREREAREQGMDMTDPQVIRWIKQSRAMADVVTVTLNKG